MPVSQRKARKRIPKESRRNLRLWAEGARETLLTPHIESYGDALERGWRAERDCLQTICNEFHAKVSWRLKDHEEPDLPFADYDPLALQAEETLSEEDEIAKRTRINMLNSRIRRWLKYRVRRLRKLLRTRLNPRKDPWAIFLAKLSNIQAPPKARQAYQQFMHEKYDDVIAPVVKERWAQEAAAGSNIQTTQSPDGPFRALIARELFKGLSEEERADYSARAKQEAAEARSKYNEDLKKPPSKTPEDRQKCIDGVGTFLGPILQGIHERTGLHTTVLLGGPIPSYAGDLRTIYVSYGRTKTGVAHFPDWAKGRWNLVLELMKEYLQVAFNEQDQQESALLEELASARYRFGPNGKVDANANPSDAESSSSASSESEDSNADSDDEVVLRKKKEKHPKGKKATAKKTASRNLADGQRQGTGREKENTTGRKGDVGTGGKKSAKRKRSGEAQAETEGEADDEAGGSQGSRKKKRRSGAREDEEGSKTPRKRKRDEHEGNTSAETPTRKSRRFAEAATSGAGGTTTTHVTGNSPPAPTPATAAMASAASASTSAPRSPTTTSLTPPEAALPTPAASATVTAPLPPTPGFVTLPEAALAAAAASASITAPLPPTTDSVIPIEAAPPAPAAITAPLPPITASTTSDAAPPAPPPASTPSNTAPPLSGPPPPSAAALIALPVLSGPTSPNSVLPSIAVTVPHDAPAWLKESIKDLRKIDVGCHFTSVLAALVRLEKAAGYEAGGDKLRLPSGKKNSRPAAISEWIRGGRGTKSKKSPVVTDVLKYEREWDTWWDSLQPDWRERDALGRWRVDGPYQDDWDWGSLECFGVNGLLSAVAGLYFWGVAVRSGPIDGLARWDNAVQDVVWVLEGLERLFKGKK